MTSQSSSGYGKAGTLFLQKHIFSHHEQARERSKDPTKHGSNNSTKHEAKIQPSKHGSNNTTKHSAPKPTFPPSGQLLAIRLPQRPNSPVTACAATWEAETTDSGRLASPVEREKCPDLVLTLLQTRGSAKLHLGEPSVWTSALSTVRSPQNSCPFGAPMSCLRLKKSYMKGFSK